MILFEINRGSELYALKEFSTLRKIPKGMLCEKNAIAKNAQIHTLPKIRYLLPAPFYASKLKTKKQILIIINKYFALMCNIINCEKVFICNF